MGRLFEQVLARAAGQTKLTAAELQLLLQADAQQSIKLFALANQLRLQFHGNEIHLRGIIEFSNYCSNNCCYCGLRRDNRHLPRYRLSPLKIFESAHQAAVLGCRTIVLQSGEDPDFSVASLAECVTQIKAELPVAVTLSFGERTKAEYAYLKAAGADRYLLKHETCDTRLFARLRPGTRLQRRLKSLKWLRDLGYQVGSGNMVGLPGQTLETLVQDLILLRDQQVDMAGIGPFIPNPHTPLGHYPGGTLDLSLKTLAVARIVMPLTHLPATTAIASIHPEGKLKALSCGANVIMPNMTPLKYRGNYQLYPGKNGSTASPEESFGQALELIKKLGRVVSTSCGHSLIRPQP